MADAQQQILPQQQPDEEEEDEAPRLQHLFAIRHGDRLDDADSSWILSAPRPWDPPLTDLGRWRARETGRKLRRQGWNITRLLCSPFLRCVQTAAEVITALCALDPSSEPARTCKDVPIDPSKVKVSLEYGLCEVMNSLAIRVLNNMPEGPFTLDWRELEALLPAGTVDHSVEQIKTKLPDWPETLNAAYQRYQETFQAAADMFPKENVVCVTHAKYQGGYLKADSGPRRGNWGRASYMVLIKEEPCPIYELCQLSQLNRILPCCGRGFNAPPVSCLMRTTWELDTCVGLDVGTNRSLT